MADEKQVLEPAKALEQVNHQEQSLETILDGAGIEGAPDQTTPEVPPAPKKQQWSFVKLFCPADVLKFEDGSTFQFRLITLNDGSGYSSNSFVKTNDEELAKNLRQTAKNPATGVVEVDKI